MRSPSLLTLVLFTVCSSAYGQVEIPVDMYTGQPSITFPVGTISSGDIIQPIVLSYNANGVAQESPFGPGWNISLGSITREVRNYPDDIGNGLATKGWFYKNASNVNIATDVGNFTPAADNSTTYDAGENTDHVKISGFYNTYDTEPDIFNYSAGGISGSFVIDNLLNIRTIPYADVQIAITPGVSATPEKKITSFTITTNDGFVYTFGYAVSATKYTYETTNTGIGVYLPTDYEMFNPTVTYNREWKLTRIDSPNGAYVTFTYTVLGSSSSTSNGEIGLYQYPDPFYANPSDIIQNTAYSTSQSSPRVYIASITGSTGASAAFTYDGILKTIVFSDTRRGTTTAERKVKTFTFGYLPVTYTYDRMAFFPVNTVQFLKTVTESSDCESLPPTEFTYTGIYTLDPAIGHPGNFLPSTKGVDEWGYPSVGNKHPFPKLYIYPSEPMIYRYRTHPIPTHAGSEFIVPGANRNSLLPTGLLRSITSPEGGVTEFKFESNFYLDPRTSTTERAGGYRIGAVSYYDGFNQVPITKTFEYTDPATGLSSGRLIRMPALAIPALKWKSPGGSAYDKSYGTSGLTTEQKFQYLLVRREGDLTQGETTHGNTVGYKVVTVRRPGAGYARFEYHIPGAYGDAATGDWAPTLNKFARNSASSSVAIGIVDSVTAWGFPFTPNPNFDHERGLIYKKSDYNSDNRLVQQTITSYQNLYKTGSAAGKVFALRYDRYPGSDAANKIFFYGKYYLLTDVIRVPAKEVFIRYDLTDVTGATKQKDSVEYLYESANHKLLTQIKRYTVEGDIYATRIKYPKDFTSTSGSGAADGAAIHTMKSNNRHSFPIETLQTFKKAGNDTVWLIGGSVVKLDPINLSRPMVRSVWKLNASPPINFNSFVQATINPTGNKFKIDSRYYEKVDSITNYTPLGAVRASYDPITRINSAAGYAYGSSIPVVQLANATLGQATFSDFESYIPGFNFSSSTPYYGTGRTGKNAFYPGVTLIDSVTKAGVSNYILSFWIKKGATVTLTLDLKNLNGSALSPAATTTITVTHVSGENDFKYIQKVIPLPATLPSTFRVELKANGLTVPPSGGSAPGLLPVIDDVFFYPENAEMVSSQYQFPFGAVSVTSGTGGTIYNEYDKLGRLRMVYDKNKDIVKRHVYQYSAQSPLVADFTASQLTAGAATTVTAVTNDCVTDATYEWDFGSGFSSGASVATHTFDNPGIYSIQLRVTSATYGTKTVTKSLTLVSSPFTVDICAKGVTGFLSGAPDVISACSAITATPYPNGMIFRVTAMAPSPQTYQWKMRDLGSSTWIDVGTNSQEYSLRIANPGTTVSFEVTCQVTSGTGQIGFSPKWQVLFH